PEQTQQRRRIFGDLVELHRTQASFEGLAAFEPFGEPLASTPQLRQAQGDRLQLPEPTQLVARTLVQIFVGCQLARDRAQRGSGCVVFGAPMHRRRALAIAERERSIDLVPLRDQGTTYLGQVRQVELRPPQLDPQGLELLVGDAVRVRLAMQLVEARLQVRQALRRADEVVLALQQDLPRPRPPLRDLLVLALRRLRHRAVTRDLFGQRLAPFAQRHRSHQAFAPRTGRFERFSQALDLGG